MHLRLKKRPRGKPKLVKTKALLEKMQTICRCSCQLDLEKEHRLVGRQEAVACKQQLRTKMEMMANEQGKEKEASDFY